MPPALVLWHIEALPDTSLTKALMHGGPEHHGWGQDRHMMADLYDAVALLTEAAGHWEKPPNLPRWPRPKTREQKTAEREAKKPVRSVKDLFYRLKK